MCHNVIDGRFHTQCGHFYGMATQMQDCLRTDCIFSCRHPAECKKTSCTRLMAPPARNPIRLSKTDCAECTQRQRLGLDSFSLSNNMNTNIKQAS
ncbi:hypothetical protein CPB83DRAFT_589740 [Crepidotus variabilis]|uniref:Uncharacterized protein n=1 Tax=Crepidotus variabilis TaxID=179855 RepID=A0A9P6JUY3_9AGAR|nr:hypothetical protein CPB83DRAFT_589740 [Crepidotus variabilis]